jgi:hypothetical protein
MLTSSDVVAIRNGDIEWHCAVAKAHARRIMSSHNFAERMLRLNEWFRFRAGLPPRGLAQAVEFFNQQMNELEGK